jgi:hypothetical protein
MVAFQKCVEKRASFLLSLFSVLAVVFFERVGFLLDTRDQLLEVTPSSPHLRPRDRAESLPTNKKLARAVIRPG